MLNYLTLVQDRYSGCYSRAEYTLWEGEPPHEIDNDDVTCDKFWCSDKSSLCLAKGSNEEEVLKKFEEKLGYEIKRKYHLLVYLLYSRPNDIKILNPKVDW